MTSKYVMESRAIPKRVSYRAMGCSILSLHYILLVAAIAAHLADIINHIHAFS